MKRQSLILVLMLTVVLSMTSCSRAEQNKEGRKSASNIKTGTSQVGNVLFSPPKGWQRLEQNGGVMFIPANASADNPPCTIGIFPGQDFNGDFKEAFNRLLARGSEGAKVLVEPQITETRDDDDVYSVLFAQTAIQSNNGEISYRFYVAAHPENRLEIFAFFAQSESVYKQYQPVFLDFVQTIEFANALEAKNSKSNNNHNPAPNDSNGGSVSNNRPAVDNGLSGFYVGTNGYNRFNPTTNFNDYIVEQLRYYFLPDGRVYYGIPRGGSLDNFNFEQLQGENPQGCGHYQLSEGQIQIQIGDAPAYTRDFAKTSYGFTFGRIKLYRVDKFDNFHLEGLYGQGTYVGTGTGGVGGDHKIAFTRDGRFQKTDFVGFAAAGTQANAATSESRAGEGSYQINGNTLELSYSDGRREKLTFYVYPENVSENPPGLIVIDGGSYLLRK